MNNGDLEVKFAVGREVGGGCGGSAVDGNDSDNT